MIRRPPRSTLFPYNDALPISLLDQILHDDWVDIPGAPGTAPGPAGVKPLLTGRARRSEEHTSELQSRFDLVCRLLLEKKKKKEKKNLYIDVVKKIHRTV